MYLPKIMETYVLLYCCWGCLTVLLVLSDSLLTFFSSFLEPVVHMVQIRERDVGSVALLTLPVKHRYL